MRPDNSPGVPLSDYLTNHKGTKVRFTCMGCMAHHDVDMGEVVERLKARKLGDENTGIRAVAWVSRNRCKRCDAIRWETTPAFPPTKPGE